MGTRRKRDRERETFLFEQVWWVDFSSARLQYGRQTGFERTFSDNRNKLFRIKIFLYTICREELNAF